MSEIASLPTTTKILSEKKYAQFCEFLANTSFPSTTTDEEKLIEFENKQLEAIRTKNNLHVRYFSGINKNLQKQDEPKTNNGKKEINFVIANDSLLDASGMKLSETKYAEFCKFLANTSFPSTTTDTEKLVEFVSMQSQALKKKNNLHIDYFSRINKNLQNQDKHKTTNGKQAINFAIVNDLSLQSSGIKLTKRKYAEFYEFLSNTSFPSTTTNAEKLIEFEKIKLQETRKKNKLCAIRYRMKKRLLWQNNIQNTNNGKQETEIDTSMALLSQQTRNIEKCKRYRWKKKLEKPAATKQQDDTSLESISEIDVEEEGLNAERTKIYRFRCEEKIEDKEKSKLDLADYEFRTHLVDDDSLLFQEDLISNESTTDLDTTNPSTKRVKLEYEDETNNEEKNLYDIPDISPKLSPSYFPSTTTGETDISAWSESLVLKLKEFDECDRSFLMDQIDKYVLGATLQRMKCEKEDENISIDPIKSFVECPSTSQCCQFVVKEEVLDIPEDV